MGNIEKDPERRRPSAWWLIGAGISAMLLTVSGIVLWWKLPQWAPDWTMRHSPFFDPAFRGFVHSSDGDTEFLKRFSGTAPGHHRATQALFRFCHSDDDGVRTAALLCLETVSDPRISPGLLDLVEQNGDPELAQEACVTLFYNEPDSGSPLYLALDPSRLVMVLSGKIADDPKFILHRPSDSSRDSVIVALGHLFLGRLSGEFSTDYPPVAGLPYPDWLAKLLPASINGFKRDESVSDVADEIETVIYLAQYLDPASVQRYWDVGDPAARVLLASCTDRGVPDTLLDRLFAALDTPLGVQSLTALACAADPRAEEELHRRAGIAGDPLQATAITLLKDLRPAPLREPLSRQAPTDPPGAVPPAYMPPPP